MQCRGSEISNGVDVWAPTLSHTIGWLRSFPFASHGAEHFEDAARFCYAHHHSEVVYDGFRVAGDPPFTAPELSCCVLCSHVLGIDEPASSDECNAVGEPDQEGFDVV